MPKQANPERLKHYQRRYGQWSGNPIGSPANFMNCSASIWSDYIERQCSRPCGHGPDGAFCKQHAKDKSGVDTSKPTR